MSREGTPSELNSGPPTPDAHARFRTVVRWLKGLTVLAVGSWVLLGLSVFLHWGEETADGNGRLASPGEASPDAARGATGRWGVLTYVPIGISPPPELVPQLAPQESGQVQWEFPDVLAERLPAMLSEMGLSEALREKLVAMAEIDPGNGGFTVRPTREMVLGLSPEDRNVLYVVLAAYREGNVDQRDAFRFCGESLDQWLEGSSLGAKTRSLIEPLVYRQGHVMFFADLRSVEPSLTLCQKQKLVMALSRESTFLMRIEVSADSDIEELVDYWGLGGRARDVQPILESARRSDGDHGIDVMHLLPPFARQRLYTYDVYTAEALRGNRDCHWSALNFFAEQPDDRFLDVDEVLRTLARDYYHIFGNPRLGDVVVFLDAAGGLVHSAVYVADDVLFTKNGPSSLHPWMLMKLDDMMDFYPRRQGLHTRYFRRKDL